MGLAPSFVDIAEGTAKCLVANCIIKCVSWHRVLVLACRGLLLRLFVLIFEMERAAWLSSGPYLRSAERCWRGADRELGLGEKPCGRRGAKMGRFAGCQRSSWVVPTAQPAWKGGEKAGGCNWRLDLFLHLCGEIGGSARGRLLSRRKLVVREGVVPLATRRVLLVTPLRPGEGKERSCPLPSKVFGCVPGAWCVKEEKGRSGRVRNEKMRAWQRKK